MIGQRYKETFIIVIHVHPIMQPAYLSLMSVIKSMLKGKYWIELTLKMGWYLLLWNWLDLISVWNDLRHRFESQLSLALHFFGS